MHKIEQGYRNLANAIIVQAANDYRRGLEGKSFGINYRVPPEAIVRECKRFFRSPWYRMLTKVDGEFLIDQLNREHKEKIRKEKEKCKSN